MVSEKSLQNLIPAKKGEIRNPEGGRAHNKIKRQIKEMNKYEWAQLLQLLAVGTIQELDEYLNNPGIGHLAHGIARALRDAANAGDWKTLKEFAEAIVGKEPLRIEIDTRSVVVHTTVAEIQEKRKEINERLRRIRGA